MLYKNAMDVLEKRREDRKNLIDRRKREIYDKIPRIQEIENRLSSTGMILLSKVSEENMSEEEAVSCIMAENRAFNEEMERLLSQNGYPSDYLNPPYFCPLCSDTGYNSENKLCSCLKTEITNRALEEANLSRHMAGQTFDKFNLAYYDDEIKNNVGIGARENARSILHVCKKFTEDFDFTETNLLFYGASGLGKTFLSSSIATELLKKGKDVLYISANSLFPILENMHFGRGDVKSAYIAEKVLDADLLILDDLGAEFITQFTASELFRIMNQRLLTSKKMVFSTNLSLQEIVNSYSERIVSRIIGNFETLRFFGEDIRKKKKYE
ncbi:MAG: ATP-binding protein [Clostridia bacterium]